MKYEDFQRIEERAFYALVAVLGLIVLLGAGAWHYMEEHGHVVTGMSNQVVWGLPHVFAIFLIVAASGVLNVASIGSVFGKSLYKARAPLSGMLALAMLGGGLAVLMLDLGRSDRIIIASTHFNPTSVFAWNIILYSGFFGIVAAYLLSMMSPRMKAYSKYIGFAAFIWRVILTTGTGSIFGFLVARQAYDSALLAPMFIVMSFSYGLAVFIVVQSAMYSWKGVRLDAAIMRRMKNLLAIFVSAVLYFTLVYHMTNLYFAKQTDFERFILLDGGIYTALFWIGQVLIGSLVPLAILFHPQLSKRCGAVVVSSMLIIFGAFCQLYVFIVGAQAFPLNLFPGMEATSTFFDGRLSHPYTPSLPEFLLGLGGIGVASLIAMVAVRVFQFMPHDDLKQAVKAETATD